MNKQRKHANLVHVHPWKCWVIEMLELERFPKGETCFWGWWFFVGNDSNLTPLHYRKHCVFLLSCAKWETFMGNQVVKILFLNLLVYLRLRYSLFCGWWSNGDYDRIRSSTYCYINFFLSPHDWMCGYCVSWNSGSWIMSAGLLVMLECFTTHPGRFFSLRKVSK